MQTVFFTTILFVCFAKKMPAAGILLYIRISENWRPWKLSLPPHTLSHTHKHTDTHTEPGWICFGLSAWTACAYQTPLSGQQRVQFCAFISIIGVFYFSAFL